MQTSAVILVFGLVGLARSATDFSVYSWEHFKEDHGKKYEDPAEDIYRKSIFEERVAKINEHNKLFFSGLETSSMIINKFTDMLPNEVMGDGVRPIETTSAELLVLPKNIKVPKEVDWRTVEGVVSPVRDAKYIYGRAPSWGYVAIDALEAQLKLKKNISVSLSAQQILDCQKRHGDYLIGAYKLIMAYGGAELEEDYPETDYIGLCKSQKSKVFTESKISGYKRTKVCDEEALTAAIATVGPVGALIAADDHFMNYHSGIYDKGIYDLDELSSFVLLVGYGTENGKDYYLGKNCWGEDWGLKGFVKIARNKHCNAAVARQNEFPVL